MELKSPRRPNKVNGYPSSDSESVEYTSLRDLLQSPACSPTERRTPKAFSPSASSSWQELPIKNPLVKQAAIAYLQPMSNQTAAFGSSGGLFDRLRGKFRCDCGGDLSCFGWLREIVRRATVDLFGSHDGADEDDDDVERVDGEGRVFSEYSVLTGSYVRR